jgi:hypothetical protein
MVVHVAIGHRRSIHNRRLVQQRLLAVHRALELVEEDTAASTHVVLVDLGKFLHPRFRCCRGATPGGSPSTPLSGYTREEASRPILNEKTRVMSALQAPAPAGRTSASRVRRTNRGRPPGARQLARFAARIARLDALDAAFDLADVVEVLVQALAVGGTELSLQLRQHLRGDPVEDAPCRCAFARRARRRAAHAEELSNATRGSRIIGSGSVGDAQLMESVYTHE